MSWNPKSCKKRQRKRLHLIRRTKRYTHRSCCTNFFFNFNQKTCNLNEVMKSLAFNINKFNVNQLRFNIKNLTGGPGGPCGPSSP